MKHSLVISFALILACFNVEAEDGHGKSLWLGEWGYFNKQVGDAKTPYSGGHITIDCDSYNILHKCFLHYNHEIEGRICGINSKFDDISSSKAIAFPIEGKNEDCNINLELHKINDVPTITATREGKCNLNCPKNALNEDYPLISNQKIDNRVYDKRCYGNPSKMIYAWCTSSKIQVLDTQLGKLDGELKKRILPTKDVDDANYHPLLERHRKEIWQKCSNDNEQEACQEKAFLQRISQTELDINETVDSYKKNGDAKSGKELIKKLEGVYKKRFNNGFIDGTKTVDEDVLEFVRISDTAVYIKTKLYFYNGHQCFIYGVAEYKKIGGFVLQTPEFSECKLTIFLKGDNLSLSDPDGVCREHSCGARGGYNNTEFPLKNKRKISYIPMLLKSEDYNKSLQEYKKSH